MIKMSNDKLLCYTLWTLYEENQSRWNKIIACLRPHDMQNNKKKNRIYRLKNYVITYITIKIHH